MSVEDRLLDEVVGQYMAAKIQSLHIKNQGGANLVYNHGCDVANKLGLSDQQKMNITPFPSPTNINVSSKGSETQDQKTEEKQRSSMLGKVGVPAAIMASGIAGGGLALGGAYLGGLLGSDKTPAPLVVPAGEHEQGNVGLEIE